MEIKRIELNEVLYHKQNAVLSFRVSYPEISPYSIGVRRINGYNKMFGKDIVERAKGVIFKAAVRQAELLGNDFEELSVDASFQTMYLHNGLFSAFTDVFYKLGADGKAMTRKSQTWNIKSGRRIRLRELFDRHTDYIPFLFNELAARITDFERKNGEPCYPDWRIKAMRFFDTGNYYLTDDGIAFFFPQGSLTAGIWGIPTFYIGFDSIRDMLGRWML
jgi:hypothetical protein